MNSFKKLPFQRIGSQIAIVFFVFYFLHLNDLVAQSGKPANYLAYAYPMDKIDIDGNLNDWPTYLPKNDISMLPYNDKIEGEGDFKAYFQVGYNQNKNVLLFSIVVEDDSFVEDTSNDAKWSTQDTYSLYIDEKHELNHSGVVKYTFNKLFGDQSDPKISWDPEIAQLQNWNNLTYAIETIGKKRIIEFQLKLTEKIQRGKVVGIDFVLIDKDIDESENSYVAWKNSVWKESDAGKLGQIMILDSQDKLEEIKGKLAWEQDTIDGYPSSIVLQSLKKPFDWVSLSLDSLGRFATELPSGKYEILLENDIIQMEDGYKKITFSDKENLISTGPDKDKVFTIAFKEKDNMIGLRGLLTKGSIQNNHKELDKFINSYLEYYNIPGVSLAIIENDEVAYYKTYGYKNLYTKEPVNKDTRFEAASITKPVFAFAVMRLAERGIIDLDKPLYQYLAVPEDVKDDPRSKLITARIVLSHSTGFPNWPWNNPNGKLDIKFEPGTKYSYSGAGYGYLQDVVEEITGKDIVSILNEETLDVLDVPHTYFEFAPDLLDNTALGHNGNYPHVNDIRPATHVASSMITDANSLAKFWLGIKNRTGLNKETYEDMFGAHTHTPDADHNARAEKHYFGLGPYFEETAFGLTLGHSGNNPGFKCDSVIFEDLGKGWVVMTNGDYGDSLINALYDFLIYGKETGNGLLQN
ncbi:serine hydrolase [Gramella sp. KN1008]|uniref:serine hydrolase domain-containing protein n=1 Tax=Gramella sp. KN1008 TaxID=2529298 RepID=UPI001038CEC9|nr:serine hydrolase domain-containing protein [Gramella sp. KN1008]TBW26546.1 class A beta-lactamase-related serine hydrolase [Gramella sp. KN1008]